MSRQERTTADVASLPLSGREGRKISPSSLLGSLVGLIISLTSDRLIGENTNLIFYIQEPQRDETRGQVEYLRLTCHTELGNEFGAWPSKGRRVIPRTMRRTDR